jgi:hypothetical protein
VKRDPVKSCCGCRFLDREIEEPLEFFGLMEGKIL